MALSSAFAAALLSGRLFLVDPGPGPPPPPAAAPRPPFRWDLRGEPGREWAAAAARAVVTAPEQVRARRWPAEQRRGCALPRAKKWVGGASRFRQPARWPS